MEIALAGNDKVRIIDANRRFWASKFDYIHKDRPLNEAYLFNENTRVSYHPWSAQAVGDAFGDAGLKEQIAPLDYLNSTPLVDEFLEGMAVGMKRANERKLQYIKQQQAKNKKNAGLTDPADIANLANNER